MTKELHRRTKHAAIAASLTAALSAAPMGAHACSDSPFLGSVCIMATPAGFGDFNQQYSVADGRIIEIGQNQALFTLLSNNYGGEYSKGTFALPDLRGRMILGLDSRISKAGQTGGATQVTLSASQLPPHTHDFSAANVDFSKVTATTTLGTMTGAISGSATLLASTTGTSYNDPAIPSPNALGKPTTPAAKIYSDGVPAVKMNPKSIDTSGLKVSDIKGDPTTILSGTAVVSGVTTPTGSSQPVPIMPPYLAMTYYIATANATYPMRGN